MSEAAGSGEQSSSERELMGERVGDEDCEVAQDEGSE
jgi:hypothetical protein